MSIIFIILAYLIGSLSSATIVSRLFNLPDPRSQGSQNAGATNVLRLSGRKPAAIVLCADALKALLPVWFAQLLGVTDMALAWVALAAVLGHIFPVFFHFKGGKGVAPALGGFFGLNMLLCLIAILIWVSIAKLTRYSSLASIAAITLSILTSPLYINRYYLVPLIIMNIFILIKHWSNIVRLIEGRESKIG
ncbi:MAG: glycerol-3-phosphate 1-O-acyltransferase PlsY [Gammaproteobacteria bacterium]